MTDESVRPALEFEMNLWWVLQRIVDKASVHRILNSRAMCVIQRSRHVNLDMKASNTRRILFLLCAHAHPSAFRGQFVLA